MYLERFCCRNDAKTPSSSIDPKSQIQSELKVPNSLVAARSSGLAEGGAKYRPEEARATYHEL